MERKKLILDYKDKKIAVNVKTASFFGGIRGLMFRKKSGNLLFSFERDSSMAIHSIFVFSPFLALWLDSRNRVLDFKIVRPFSLYVNTSRKYRKILEMPLSKENEEIIKCFYR